MVEATRRTAQSAPCWPWQATEHDNVGTFVVQHRVSKKKTIKRRSYSATKV